MILESHLPFPIYGALMSGGESDTAHFVARQADERKRSLRSTWTFGHAYQEALRSLESVAQSCAQADWDGYGAEPVLPATVYAANRFLEALPPELPGPTVGAEPDGHITLEWYRSPQRLLSVSVGPDDSLHYAAILGPNKQYGTEIFFGDVPASIIGLIRRIQT